MRASKAFFSNTIVLPRVTGNFPYGFSIASTTVKSSAGFVRTESSTMADKASLLVKITLPSFCRVALLNVDAMAVVGKFKMAKSTIACGRAISVSGIACTRGDVEDVEMLREEDGTID